MFLLEVLVVVKAFQLSIPGRLLYHFRILALSFSEKHSG